MTDLSMDVGRVQWDLVQSARCLRDTLRRCPEARQELDNGMLDEAIAEVMGIVGDLSTERNIAEHKRQKEAA